MASSFASELSSLLSWCVAGGCTAIAWRKRRRLELLAPASEGELLLDLAAGKDVTTLDHASRSLAIAELNQRLSDVAFELELQQVTSAALTRICLASCTVLALVGFLMADEAQAVQRVARLAIAASAGFVGAAAVAGIGRMARIRTREIRENWDNSSRGIGNALGTRLAPAESRSR